MNGYELARALRQQGSTALLVAVTGWSSEGDEARSKSAGFGLQMTKPADPEAVQAVLQQLF
jgi:CheY-like chemotaxis protein